MSWFISKAVKITDGSEFNGGERLEHDPTVEYHKCEYCGEEILIVDDKARSGWGFYYGNQAVKPNVYRYSPIIMAIKKFYGRTAINPQTDELEIWPFDQRSGNNLANLHSRCHPVGKDHQYDWDLRAGRDTIKLLCNRCFDKTKNRYQVDLEDGRRVAISVVEDRGETPESVLKDLGLKGTIVGKGGQTGW